MGQKVMFRHNVQTVKEIGQKAAFRHNVQTDKEIGQKIAFGHYVQTKHNGTQSSLNLKNVRG